MPGRRTWRTLAAVLGGGEERCSTLDRDQLLLDAELAAQKIETGHRQTEDFALAQTRSGGDDHECPIAMADGLRDGHDL
ncbi:MAG TPA: hypothetical protein VID75_04505, partial [Acidimicrobiales bacterium]